MTSRSDAPRSGPEFIDRDGVVIFANSLSRGGAEGQAAKLALALRERQVPVHFATVLPRVALTQVEHAGIEVQSLGDERPNPLAVVRRATSLLRQWRPQAVVTFMYQSNMIGRVAARAARVPVVVSSIRNEHFGGRHRDLLMKATDRLATITTTNSELAASGLIGRGVVPSDRMRVVRNALDLTAADAGLRTRERTRASLGLAPDDFAWMTIARLQAQKDYPTLVAAVRTAAATHPHMRVFAIGAGPDRDAIAGQISAAGLADVVTLLGMRDDVPDLLGAADGFVLTSAWEGLPNAVIEAAAARLPIVATDVGGTSEIVADGRSGLLTPPRDPSAIANAMVRVMSDPEVATGFGQSARQHVEASFALDSVMDDWISLLTTHGVHIPDRPRTRS